MLVLFQISATFLEGKHFLQGGAYFNFGNVRCGAYFRPGANYKEYGIPRLYQQCVVFFPIFIVFYFLHTEIDFP